MKASVCVTTYNEEVSIAKLLDSLILQSKKADEIIIVDGKSTDKTADIVKDYQKAHKNIRLHVRKCTLSEGRNMAVNMAKYDIIAMTDAGCVARFDWLEKITLPFENRKTDVVAGFYKMVGDKPIQKAASVFLGTLPNKFDDKYLPSARSIAFRKKVWKKVGGFPKDLKSTAEDTVFAYKLVKMGCEIVRVKNAIVEWVIPDNLAEIAYKFYAYAKGDSESKIFWHLTKGITSHNIKVIFVFMRYLTGLILIVLTQKYPILWTVLGVGILIYVIYSFNKTYRMNGKINIGFWGVILQFVSDFSVMVGFVRGIVRFHT